MNSNKNTLVIAGVIVLALVAVFAVISVRSAKGINYSFGGEAELRNTIEFSMNDIDSLDISYGSNNIEIFQGSDDKVVIKEYLASDDKSAWAETEVVNRKARVTGSKMIHFIFFGFVMNERIEVYLPKEGLEDLAVSTGSGNITTQTGYEGNYDALAVSAGSGNIKWYNTEANFSVGVGSGNVKLENIVGAVSVGAGSGEIYIDNVKGEVSAGAGSGNVDVEGLEGFGSFDTSSGNVKVEFTELTGDVEAEAGSGNVKVILPEATSGHVTLKAGSGNINTDFDDSLSFDRDGNHAEGEIGSGAQHEIYVHTGSGNINLKAN